MRGLPERWASVPIGNLIDLSPKNDCDDETEVGFVPMSLMGTSYRDRVKYEARQWGRVKKGYTHFADGDVLLAKITPCFENGKAGLALDLPNGLGAGSTEYFVCRPKEAALHPGYLLAYFKTTEFLRNGAVEMIGSVGHKRVPKEYVTGMHIPLAPLPEQKRIADKLDSVLARVDACRDRLDRIPALLKRFRQSILAAATSGQLTEDWRDSLALEELPWEEAAVENLLLDRPRNGYSPKAVDYPTAVKSLTLSATTSGVFKPEHHKYIDEEIPANAHLWLKRNDVLIQRANSREYVGVSALVDVDIAGCIYPDLMMKCQANDRVLPVYLFLILSSEPVRHHFRKNATGTAGNMPKINQQTVVSAPCKLPPLSEQHEIVRRVEAVFGFADRLEARYAAARKQIEQLTPALLAKAFRGELVPQDPDDEPAAELLKRLATNRAEAPKARRGRKAASCGA